MESYHSLKAYRPTANLPAPLATLKKWKKKRTDKRIKNKGTLIARGRHTSIAIQLALSRPVLFARTDFAPWRSSHKFRSAVSRGKNSSARGKELATKPSEVERYMVGWFSGKGDTEHQHHSIQKWLANVRTHTNSKQVYSSKEMDDFTVMPCLER